MTASRRNFLKYASLAAAGNLAGLSPFGRWNALAQSTSDYKALVCVFLRGGNDCNNTIIPFEDIAYKNYASTRKSLAIPQYTTASGGPGVLPLNGGQYALHYSLPGVQSLYNSGAAALVANVGTLVQPMTAAQYRSATPSMIPSLLFSHGDQQTEWLNAASSSVTQTGWGGRIADAMNATANPNGLIPMVANAYSNSVFCEGASTLPIAVVPPTTDTTTPYSAGGCSAFPTENATYCATRVGAAQAIAQLTSGASMVSENPLIKADNSIATNAYSFAQALTKAIPSPRIWSTTTIKVKGDPFSAQMEQIAQVINVQKSLGMSRQIFFAEVYDFDTHSSQMANQPLGLSSLDHGLSSFYAATQEMGLANNVTTFAISEFGRTLAPNTIGGSDHGWGGHEFVIGGAVKGGQLYGTYPSMQIGGVDDINGGGRWVPSTSSVQFAATLAQWFGVPTSQMATIFPTLKNFNTAITPQGQYNLLNFI